MPRARASAKAKEAAAQPPAVSLDLARVFTQVARIGTIAGAARALNMDASLATRKLAQLELALGARLVERTTRSMKLTEAGRVALAWASDAVDHFEQAADEVALLQGRPSGVVRLAVAQYTALQYLPSLLAEFCARHPEIRLVLSTTDTLVNLVDDGYDIAIHSGRIPDSGMVGKRLREFQRILCASPDYLARRGEPVRPEDLAAHDCLVHAANEPRSWFFRRGATLVSQAVRARVESDNYAVLLELARQSLGILRVSENLVAEDIRAGRLVQVLAGYRCVYPNGELPAMNRRNLLKLASLGVLQTSFHRVAAAAPGGLTYQVFTATRPGLNREVPPGKEPLMWVANSSTLIAGERDAVLVDSFLTTTQTKALADGIAATGKRLTTIYVTHAHGDHFLGLQVLLERFPKARAVATPEVAAGLRRQGTPEKLDARWRKLFPGQISDTVAFADAMDGDTLRLEDHDLVAVKLGHTDTDDSTCLHVPSIGLVVAGDAVYNGIHPFMIDSDRRGRVEWLAALDKIEALQPQHVVAGHKIPANDDNPACIAQTRQYIRDFIRLNDDTATARELYDRMLELYPDRVNPGSLWSSAQAAKKQAP